MRTFITGTNIDLKRRGFLFGAVAATVVLPAAKSFFILPKVEIARPALIIPSFDLPLQQLYDLQRKLEAGMLEISAVPDWLRTSEQEWKKKYANGIPINLPMVWSRSKA